MTQETKQKISRGLKRYYAQLVVYRDIYKTRSFKQARYAMRRKNFEERQLFLSERLPEPEIPVVKPPEPPKAVRENEYEFNFADITETDYETKMIADVGLHDFLADYIDKNCYDSDENAYKFDLHITQVYKGVLHSESLADWQMDAESYESNIIATIILIKIAKMKSAVPFVSQPAILTIEVVND